MMNEEEIFESCTRSAGDLAGVFEHDGETGYFYLYSTTTEPGRRILGFIPVSFGDPDFVATDIEIRWDRDERHVGLFIRGVLWAAFDGDGGAKYGGGYTREGTPDLPQAVRTQFRATAR